MFSKLLKLESTMQTPAGRAVARPRTEFLRDFQSQLRAELGGPATH